jgi:hypothetical protein
MLGAAPGVTVILGDPASTFQESPRYIPAVAKGMGLTLVELDQQTESSARPFETFADKRPTKQQHIGNIERY